MRLHHVRATAFGPFGETVEIDFDQLAGAGLFLLTGATGAGKTSVLDAVCFGLYGEVPGDRHQARHLRSDHAAPDVAPEVVVTFSVAGRTLRLTRSPAWDRPRRRRPGTTRQPARVVVEEQLAGGWQGLTTRLDDAGLLVGDLLGMTCTQFTQVALLPQGRFQAFLRASSAERHAVLQRLFRTDRFERVEQWLVERRLALRRESQGAHARVAGLVHRVQEAAAEPAPDGWDLDDLAGPAGDGSMTAWVRGLVDRVHADSTAAGGTAVEAGRAASAANDALEAGRRLVDLRTRASRAEQDRARLAAERPRIDDLRRALDAHHRAAPVAALVDRLRVAERAAVAAGERATAALTALSLEASDPGAVAARRLAAVRAHAALAAARPREQVLESSRTALVAATRRRAAAERAAGDLDAEASSLPQRRAALHEELDAARTAGARLAGLDAELARAREGHRAALELRTAQHELVEARQRHQQAVDLAQELREAYLTAREHRIAAMAGELAAALVSGCACPVCGSAEHPAPAARADASSREREDAARRDYETAEAARLAHAEAVAPLEARVQALTSAAAGGTPDSWAETVTAAVTARAAAQERAARADELAAAAETLEAAAAEHQARLRSVIADLAAAEADIARLTDLVADVEAELADLRGDFDSIAQATDHHAALARELTAADELLAEHARLEAALRDLTAAADETARDAGFDGVRAVDEALLAADAAATAEDAVASWDRALGVAEETLRDPDVRSALERPVADVEALEQAAADTAAAHHRARVQADRLTERHRRLVDLCDRLDVELRAWAPVRSALEVASGLASFVEGKSTDNPFRMRLSAYVLGERLRQVVAAANVRLARMTGQRYSLEHSDERGVGAQRGGLSLLVRDDWSGVLRDPATLSGGETFVVSLALALGLADTVAHEAGGASIDMLFVDEGFGSLDADTLEDVMDVLDGLREGGRVIGVVSHVAELRDRITTQLEVRKGRHGSHVVAH
jgi:exonuclease SbcC